MNASPDSSAKVAGVTSQGPGKRSPRVLPAGTVLENRYEIQRVAGRGGMSTVYAARDLRFGQVERMCAVKEMGDNETDPGTRALSLVNFERESALLATIAHPAVPKIYDYFADGGMIYLVLEFIDGDDLERALSKRKAAFPEELVIEWALQICDVLEMLHSFQPSPIIFRDLKPSNIMLRSSGRIALIDFGIARTFQAAQRGTMIGTEGYAPPEQYRGMADARGDIYALGATLHHLLTNSDPRHQTPFTFQERPIQSLNATISDELTAIVSRMLAYHPDQRFQTATEVRLAVEALKRRRENSHVPAVASDVSSTARPYSAPDNTAAGQTAQPVERRRPSRKRVLRKQRTVEQVSDRVAWATATGDEVRGTAAFDGESAFVGSYDRRVYCIAPDDGTVRWRYETGRGVVSRPAVAPGSIIFGSEDSAVYCLDVRSGAAIWQHRTSMPVRSSPVVDDQRVIIGSDDATVYCFDVGSGETLWKQRTWGPVRSTPAISNDLVIVGGDDGYLYGLNKHSGEITWRVQGGGSIQSEPAIAGSMLVTTSRSGAVAAFEIATGRRMWVHHASGPVVASPRVDNGTVIVGVADGALIALSLDDGQLLWVQRYANQITSSPLLGSSTGYIGTIDGACLAFEIETGDLVWRHEFGGSIVSSPSLAGEVLVIGSTDCRVFGVALANWEIQELAEQKASI